MWIGREGLNTETNEKEAYIEEITRNSIEMSDVWNRIKSTRTDRGGIELDDFILICNVVAAESGSDDMDIFEKALVVEVIMNRYRNAKEAENSNKNTEFIVSGQPVTIKNIVGCGSAFQNSLNYINYENFSDRVNKRVLYSVEDYFTAYDEWEEYEEGYLYFIGDGTHNYFSSKYPKSTTDKIEYYCPSCSDKPYAIVSLVMNNDGKLVPKILGYK